MRGNRRFWRFPKSVGRGGDGTASSSVFHPFDQTGISTAARGYVEFARECWWSVDLSSSLLVADLLAVVLHLRLVLYVLLRLDQDQRMAETLVLDDSGVTESLILAEGPR
jgi:hypothetical protein